MSQYSSRLGDLTTTQPTPTEGLVEYVVELAAVQDDDPRRLVLELYRAERALHGPRERAGRDVRSEFRAHPTEFG